MAATRASPEKVLPSENRRLSGAEIAERRESFIADVQKYIQQKGPEKPFVAKNLTPCQAEKLKALFEKYFDVDNDGIITERDIQSLNEKFVDFTGWDPEDPKMVKLLEYHKDLYKCLLMEVNKEIIIEEQKTNEVTLTAWMKMWDRLMKGSLALMHLPQWVQVMPFNLFSYIDKNGENHISKQNLFEFYTDFMLLDDKRGKIVTENAWAQMTGNGDFKLTLDLYAMIFSNFLFGKTFYGPGLFILGTSRECYERVPYKIEAPREDEH